MKLRKICFLITATFILFGGFFIIKPITIRAEESKKYKLSQIWDNSAGKASISVKDEFANIAFKPSEYIKFKNKLAFEYFSMDLSIQKAEFESLAFEFTSDAPENSSESTVVNTITFSSDGEIVTAKLNDGEITAELGDFEDDYTVNFSINIDKGVCKVGGIELGEIKEVKKYIANLQIKNTGKDNANFNVVQINGQELKVNGTTSEIISTDIAPTIVMHDNLEDGFFIPLGLIYTFDYDAFDVLSSTVTTVLKYEKADDEDVKFESKNKSFIIIKADNLGDDYKVSIEAKDDNDNTFVADEPYIVTVKKDNQAPILTADQSYFDEYQERVEKAAYSNFDEEKFVDLGSGEYYYIPSFEKMFSDQSSYKNILFDMEYDTPSATGRKSSKLAASSLKIELTEVGTYSFKLKAIDQLGNVCEDFSPIFSFKVENTSGPRITAPSSNDTGYLGSTYNSNSFTIKGVGIVTEYKLEYRATPNEEFKEAEEELSGLSFTPTALGEYKITASVYDISGMFDQKSTIIEIKDKVKVIRGEVNWAKDNILSIIFLCTGSLSLLGIIVLLLIKPSEVAVEVADKKTFKKQKN